MSAKVRTTETNLSTASESLPRLSENEQNMHDHQGNQPESTTDYIQPLLFVNNSESSGNDDKFVSKQYQQIQHDEAIPRIESRISRDDNLMGANGQSDFMECISDLKLKYATNKPYHEDIDKLLAMSIQSVDQSKS